MKINQIKKLPCCFFDKSAGALFSTLNRYSNFYIVKYLFWGVSLEGFVQGVMQNPLQKGRFHFWKFAKNWIISNHFSRLFSPFINVKLGCCQSSILPGFYTCRPDSYNDHRSIAEGTRWGCDQGLSKMTYLGLDNPLSV